MEHITELHSALQAIDKVGADILLEQDTEITILETSFLHSHQILRILWRRVLSPVMFYIGFAPPESVFSLTGDPESFIKMCQADKVFIETPQQALEYLSVFLEVTRSMNQLFYPIHSSEEIQWRKELNEAGSARVKAVEEKYRNLAPQAEVSGYRFLVKCHVMRNNDLISIQAYVTASGAMEVETKVLETKLPAAYGA